eukprot:jgi/Ulvmu1/8369/UM042_0075.1
MDDHTSVIVPPTSFPTCIVWTPIPFITAFFPFIGHMGVCSSQGTIHDFAGNGVVRGNFAFGNPTRYVQLRPDAAAALASRDDVCGSWDSALGYTSSVFNDRMYSLCGCNCHNLVAHFLEQVRFAGHHSWSIVYLGWLLFRHGHFVSTPAALYTWLPSLAIAALLVWLLGPARAALLWAATCVVTLAALVATDAAVRRVFQRREAEPSFAAKYGPPPHTWARTAAGFWDATLRPEQYLVQDPVIVRTGTHAV